VSLSERGREEGKRRKPDADWARSFARARLPPCHRWSSSFAQTRVACESELLTCSTSSQSPDLVIFLCTAAVTPRLALILSLPSLPPSLPFSSHFSSQAQIPLNSSSLSPLSSSSPLFTPFLVASPYFTSGSVPFLVSHLLISFHAHSFLISSYSYTHTPTSASPFIC
jgi:hypothetical protein